MDHDDIIVLEREETNCNIHTELIQRQLVSLLPFYFLSFLSHANSPTNKHRFHINLPLLTNLLHSQNDG